MSKLTEALNILANTDCASFKRSEPTAEEALEWLAAKGLRPYQYDGGGWAVQYKLDGHFMVTVFRGPTPLEAIRNAMKGGSDG